MGRGRLGAVAAAVLLVAVTGGAVLATRGDAARRDPVAAAVDAVPAATGGVDVTVWSRISGSLDDAGLRDLTTRSAIASVGDEMDDLLGWGPSDLAWEAFASVPGGAVVVLSLDDVGTSRVARSWDDVADRTGTLDWTLGDAGVSSGFAATFERVRLLESRRLLVAGAPAAVTAAVATIEGRTASVLDDRSAADVVRAVGGAASTAVRRGGTACSADPLDDGTTAALRSVEQERGALADPRWTARAITDDRPQRLAFLAGFASPAQARAQLTVREALTRGPFLGRTGQVSDSLRDLEATVERSVVALDFALTSEAESFMTDTGPVVFSGCAVPSPA